MGERKANCKKRDAEDAECEASSTSFRSLKRMRLGTDSVDSHGVYGSSSQVTKVFPPAYSDSSSGGCSASSAGENDDQSSSVCSGCSSRETNELAKDELKFVDPKAPQISETEISTCITNNFREERVPAREFSGEAAEMDSRSTATATRDRRKPPAASKSPTEAELEEFFSGAEKYEQKRFAEKYNYDVVKDTPLEGRYQWVHLKP
ncbi:PREDICTED: cyclin-dependent kinase inhibitor 7 [Tarenaya hassleriana]|uniref:cyclin-dependent kinase inhibitor 7 n=1 Tax=Tarenaya hassleriana TaxID=28532 RepID=UPI00053C7E54|nr:PREDICTED: cyclin-dependent kinase inhibitor 7 [Tarenaya hassleriana]